jgi:hypothetical protein
MHNIIVDDERDEGLFDQGWQFQGEFVAPRAGPSLLLHVHHDIRDLHTNVSTSREFD